MKFWFDWSIKLALNTISNGELSDPLCDSVIRADWVVTAPLPNAQQQVRVSRVLGDDHFKWRTRITVNLARTLKETHISIAMSAGNRSNPAVTWLE